MDRLSHSVRPYAWGSTTAIPELLGVEPTGEPQAELWLGAHPAAPSRIDRGHGSVPLPELIEANPEAELGAATVENFGPRLPFLLKVLAAASPLSLQVHPDREQARAGFAEEEASGPPLDAPERNYKDANHKPELLCALGPFEGLCGFRHPADAGDLLGALEVDSLQPYCDILHASPEEDALREVFTAVLTADRHAIAETVDETAQAAARLAECGGARAREYAAYAGIAAHYPGDAGVLAAMLLNHVSLEAGEAMYLGAGVPHCYLGGLGVELMANSDNVLRCGLTPKHIDIDELLRIVRFVPQEPTVLRPEAAADGTEIYETPVREFRLSRHLLSDGAAPRELTGEAAQIVLCTAGAIRLTSHPATSEERELPLGRGESAYIPATEPVLAVGEGTLFRATVAC